MFFVSLHVLSFAALLLLCDVSLLYDILVQKRVYQLMHQIKHLQLKRLGQVYFYQQDFLYLLQYLLYDFCNILYHLKLDVFH